MIATVAAGEADPASLNSVPDAAPVKAQDRIASLDFIRGIAVMGILAANIIAFGQPPSAYIWPDAFLIEPADPGGWQWIAQFVLIDGKMRGLFTLLFGAGMYLFMERTWARGSTRWLQTWRLIVLLGFGLLHFYLIWFGDILAMYALIGFLAVAFMGFQAGTQIRIGLFIYALGVIFLGGVFLMQYLIAETAVFDGADWIGEARSEIASSFEETQADEAKLAALTMSGDYPDLIAERWDQQWFFPFLNPLFFFQETLPLMLIGMGLYRQGFFSGAFSPAKMKLWGWIGVVAGAAGFLALGLFVQSVGFSYGAGTAAFMGWSMVPRLMMVLGLAALLVEYSKTATGWLAERISAAGRAAFTNYLGTSIVMMLVFQGWGLGLFGELNRPQLYLVTALTCGLMLAWSKPWLDRFRYGPLEWLWRCLTYRRLFPMGR
ncbi:MAG: DUF418 domain-containing protein [Erythrobacter sp.]|uniref:DUF418 domain-containing protein n=1 Tax=Erythrobacter sp. TaxID=1042 RepID=UPI002632D02F|nr:DUF418 domain-containing protein [Erythrobacter sp.]MDJ0978915.1 DUF418 domain-containing protein [Erythrobacter sp.]